MRYRKLQIAWSVAWGTVAVLLVVLWARSYRWTYGASGTTAAEFNYSDVIFGDLYYSRLVPVSDKTPIPWRRFGHPISDADRRSYSNRTKPNRHLVAIRWNVFANGWLVSIPLWTPSIVALVLAFGPWIEQIRRGRFSLRTLLVATTLIAALLGLVVWLLSP